MRTSSAKRIASLARGGEHPPVNPAGVGTNTRGLEKVDVDRLAGTRPSNTTLRGPWLVAASAVGRRFLIDR